MTKVAILPVPSSTGAMAYHATTGDKHSSGATVGQALDALTAQLPEAEEDTLVIVRSFRPDRFFDVEQQRRLGELMDRWRAARDAGAELPDEEQAELESLVEEEVRASGKRASWLSELAG